MIESFRSKSSLWKAMYLSIGGCLILINSILSFILIYPLSVRLLLIRVQNSLLSIMAGSFWEGSRMTKERCIWPIGTLLPQPARKEDLKSPKLGDINANLLVKWISCYGIEYNRLWRRVVYARSGASLISLTLSLGTGSRKIKPHQHHWVSYGYK